MVVFFSLEDNCHWIQMKMILSFCEYDEYLRIYSWAIRCDFLATAAAAAAAVRAAWLLDANETGKEQCKEWWKLLLLLLFNLKDPSWIAWKFVFMYS